MLDNLTEEQVYQLGVLDEYIRYVGTAELEKITGEAKTVAKLKDTHSTPSFIIGMVDQLTFQQNKIMNLEADVFQMQTHIREITDSLNSFMKVQRTALSEADSKMTSVKSYHGIWS